MEEATVYLYSRMPGDKIWGGNGEAEVA